MVDGVTLRFRVMLPQTPVEKCGEKRGLCDGRKTRRSSTNTLPGCAGRFRTFAASV